MALFFSALFIFSSCSHPMFGRYLSTVGSPPARTALRHWYPPGHSWWTRPPHFQHQSTSFGTVRHPSDRPPRPPDPYNWSSWRNTGVLPHTYPRRGVHLSRGLMDPFEREPPQKRRKSTEGRPPAEGRSPAERSSRSQERLPPKSPTGSPEWLRNGTNVPVPPGKFPSAAIPGEAKTCKFVLLCWYYYVWF